METQAAYNKETLQNQAKMINNVQNMGLSKGILAQVKSYGIELPEQTARLQIIIESIPQWFTRAGNNRYKDVQYKQLRYKVI